MWTPWEKLENYFFFLNSTEFNIFFLLVINHLHWKKGDATLPVWTCLRLSRRWTPFWTLQAPSQPCQTLNIVLIIYLCNSNEGLGVLPLDHYPLTKKNVQIHLARLYIKSLNSLLLILKTFKAFFHYQPFFSQNYPLL